VVKSDVGDNSRNRCEGEAIGEGELSREEKGRVFVIHRFVELHVVAHDGRNIVFTAPVIKGMFALHRQKVGVPSTRVVNPE
jgi:hypothetical protein